MDIGVRHTPHSSELELEVTPPGGNVDWQMALLDGAGWKPTPPKAEARHEEKQRFDDHPPSNGKKLVP